MHLLLGMPFPLPVTPFSASSARQISTLPKSLPPLAHLLQAPPDSHVSPEDLREVSSPLLPEQSYRTSKLKSQGAKRQIYRNHPCVCRTSAFWSPEGRSSIVLPLVSATGSSPALSRKASSCPLGLSSNVTPPLLQCLPADNYHTDFFDFHYDMKLSSLFSDHLFTCIVCLLPQMATSRCSGNPRTPQPEPTVLCLLANVIGDMLSSLMYC